MREPITKFTSLGRIGDKLNPESNFSKRHRADVKKVERLGGNECDHLGRGLWAAQFG
jgi:hypothetical protein